MENEEDRIRKVLENKNVEWLREHVITDVYWSQVQGGYCHADISNYLEYWKWVKDWPVSDLVDHLAQKSRASVCNKGFYMVLTPPYGLSSWSSLSQVEFAGPQFVSWQ